MDNFNFIKKFQLYDQSATLIHLPYGDIVYNKKLDTRFENYLLIKTLLKKEDFVLVEEEFKKLERIPTIYFEDKDELLPNTELLRENGYKNSWKDSWMFYKELISFQNEFTKVKEVKSEKELQLFVETFDNSYQKNDPQNPYGDVKEYLGGIKEKWEEYGQTEYIKYFIDYADDAPVGVAALTSTDGLGYISAVGTLQNVRGKGYGKLITQYAVYISQQIGNTSHFLLTEEGTYPYEFYQRIGFVHQFSTLGYFK